MKALSAKFGIGQVVRHRKYPFRGLIYDVDPVFANTEEWWLSIPEDVRPSKEQPFYHLFAENTETEYIAYVSEQNLLPDESGEPLRHPQIDEIFVRTEAGEYKSKAAARNIEAVPACPHARSDWRARDVSTQLAPVQFKVRVQGLGAVASGAAGAPAAGAALFSSC